MGRNSTQRGSWRFDGRERLASPVGSDQKLISPVTTKPEVHTTGPDPDSEGAERGLERQSAVQESMTDRAKWKPSALGTRQRGLA